jgi:hypothetical protein
MHSAQETKINLLPPSDFELSFWGKFLKWGVTTGRYVIIVTELIVIIAFLSRFKLDSEVASLTDEIRGKKNLLDAQTEFETQFLKIQNRLSSADLVMNSSLLASEETVKVESTVPVGVKLVSLDIQKTVDGITANTTEKTSLGTMLRQMSKMNSWKSIDVVSLSADDIEGIIMTLNLKR